MHKKCVKCQTKYQMFKLIAMNNYIAYTNHIYYFEQSIVLEVTIHQQICFIKIISSETVGNPFQEFDSKFIADFINIFLYLY